MKAICTVGVVTTTLIGVLASGVTAARAQEGPPPTPARSTRRRPERRSRRSRRTRPTPVATSRRAPSSATRICTPRFSFDAGAFGCTPGPAGCLSVRARASRSWPPAGSRVKLSRPLDFLVVADHSDNMGFFTRLLRRQARSCSPIRPGRKWYDLIQAGKGGRGRGVRDHRRLLAGEVPARRSSTPPARRLIARPGARSIKAADEANDPGRFTAFIGYEWTSIAGGNNLHRNVIFRDDGVEGQPGRALHHASRRTAAPIPRDLWKWMAAYEEKTGGELLAIAHNGNLSNGTMFPIIESFTGKRDRPRIRRDAREVGARSTRSRRSRATARRIPSSRPTTSSPTSSAGTRATST